MTDEAKMRLAAAAQKLLSREDFWFPSEYFHKTSGGWIDEETADYLTACNPKTILELIQETLL